jgi:membrane protein DedA with SNARE-associated domain
VDRIAEWAVGVVELFGYPGLTLLLILETVFPPVPSEVILPMAGFLTGQGRLVFPLVIVAATVGSVIGALLLYWIGRALGEDRVRRFIENHGKWLLLDVRDFERAKEWFDHHSDRAVLLARMAPGVRSLISIPAGIDRVPLWRFVLLTTLGSGVWNAVLVAAGWMLGQHWNVVDQYVSKLGWVVGGLIAILIARFVYGKAKAKQHA